jgi:hypothetical protein
MLKIEIPPPLPSGVKFFAEVQGADNACLHTNPDNFYYNPEDWHVIAEGYKLGAEAIIERAAAGVCEWDYLAFPAGFLYRHYLELRLKEILRRAGYVVNLPQPDLPIDHDLHHLWFGVCNKAACKNCDKKRAHGGAKKLVEAIWKTQDLTEIEAAVLEFDAIDPSSFSFRYPVDTAGKKNLLGLKAFHLGWLGQAMRRVCWLLDGATEGIETYREMKSDLQAEANSNAY